MVNIEFAVLFSSKLFKLLPHKVIDQESCSLIVWLNGSKLAVRQAASSNRVEKSSSGLPYVKVIWAGLERLSAENSTASLVLKVVIQNNESPSLN